MATPTSNQAGIDANADGTLRTITTIVAATFLLVGVAGFIPGITTNYDDMTFVGHTSDAKLVGVFEVSVLHNIVHLLFGVVGLAMARRADTARTYLIGGGTIYFILWIYGVVVEEGSDANFVPLNDADNWLHLGLAVGMILLGLALGRTRRARTTAADVR
jgi:Domain of unknown function (DUF4383)